MSDHFGKFTEMVPIGSNAKRGFPSYQLSRYACYLIISSSTIDFLATWETLYNPNFNRMELHTVRSEPDR